MKNIFQEIYSEIETSQINIKELRPKIIAALQEYFAGNPRLDLWQKDCFCSAIGLLSLNINDNNHISWIKACIANIKQAMLSPRERNSQRLHGNEQINRLQSINLNDLKLSVEELCGYLDDLDDDY